METSRKVELLRKASGTLAVKRHSTRLLEIKSEIGSSLSKQLTGRVAVASGRDFAEVVELRRKICIRH